MKTSTYAVLAALFGLGATECARDNCIRGKIFQPPIAGGPVTEDLKLIITSSYRCQCLLDPIWYCRLLQVPAGDRPGARGVSHSVL